jgi:hypothetical protein
MEEGIPLDKECYKLKGSAYQKLQQLQQVQTKQNHQPQAE